MTKSEILYNRLAPYFSSYSKRKQLYLDSIDKIVVKLIDKKGTHMLDVGAGDGVRGNKIFKLIRFKKLVSIDNSAEMISLCESRFKNRLFKLDISSDDTMIIVDKFDVITCLWNVLGHIPTQKKRLKAMIKMKKLLKDKGKIFIDVSNRYNIAYYGLLNVFTNMVKDLISHSEKNGEFAYTLRIDKRVSIPSSNHFFTPNEMEKLIRDAGLAIVKKIYINYNTGVIEKTFLKGNLFYMLM